MKYQADDSAIIDSGAIIGENTKIWHFSHICAGSEIGSNCSLGQNVFVAPKVIIGNNVKIQNNVSLYEGVIIEDEVFCGPSMVFTNVYNPRSAISRKHEYRKTRIKRGVTIGANATIICGITIGEHAFIGAGAVVNSDVKPYAIMLGVPAKFSGFMCKCGVRLDSVADTLPIKISCHACILEYVIGASNCTCIS